MILSAIPLTHILLWCTFTGVATAFFILTHNPCALAALACCFFIPYLNIKNIGIYKYLALFFFITASCIVIRINHKKNLFLQHQSFLQTETIVCGYIENIQHNTQESPTTTLLLRTKKIYNKQAGTLYVPQLITIQMPQTRSTKLQIGQQVTFYKVVLQQPDDAQPYARYLIKEGIWATTYIASERFYIHKKHSVYWYQKIKHKLMHHFQSITKYLYNPLFLGNKQQDHQALYIQHQSLYWGIAHHMARSGIHLVTILGLLISLFHYMRIRHRARFVIYALLTIAYCWITIPSLSITRSLCMILIQMFSRFHGYQYSSVHALCLTTLCTILYNPYHVLFLDFQLSFGVTAIIIWLFYIKWTKTIALFPPFLAPS